jgi:hypothetical protein
MIGEMIGELTGKIIGQRVVRHYGKGPEMERTMESKGKLLGAEVTLIATFISRNRHEGGQFQKGHGILTTPDGETAMMHGSGISIPKKGPGMSVRGARYLQTTSLALKRLNNVVLVFEIEVSPDGIVHDKMWEWK